MRWLVASFSLYGKPSRGNRALRWRGGRATASRRPSSVRMVCLEPRSSNSSALQTQVEGVEVMGGHDGSYGGGGDGHCGDGEAVVV